MQLRSAMCQLCQGQGRVCAARGYEKQTSEGESCYEIGDQSKLFGWFHQYIKELQHHGGEEQTSSRT